MIRIIKVFSFFFALSLCFLASFNFCYAQTAGLLLNARQQFFDKNGNPLSLGTVTTYIPGTTNFKTTWQDSTETTPNTNPINLDASGYATIYGQGAYRQIVKDSKGNLIWDAVTVPGGFTSSATLVGDGQPVGSIKQWAGIVAPNQYLFAYGQTVSRIEYVDLYNAITIQQPVTCSNNSSTITGLSDTTQISTGTVIELVCVPPGTTVVSKTNTTVTLNNISNLSVQAVATFFPWGDGDGSTTFNIPDLRGVALIGRPNMGGTDKGNISSTYYGANPDGQGTYGGLQTSDATIAQTNLPNINLSSSSLTATTTISPSQVSAGTQVPEQSGGSAVSGIQLATLSATTTIGGNVPLGGSGTPLTFGVIQPSVTINYIIKAIADTNQSTTNGVASLGDMTGNIACGVGIVCSGNTISASGVPFVNGNNGQVIIGQGLSNAPLWKTLSGDVASVSITGAVTLSSINGVSFPSSPSVGTAPYVSNTNSITYGIIPVTAGGTGLASFTANAPILGNGTSSFVQGIRAGNTTTFPTADSSLINGHCLSADSLGGIMDAGGPCTTGGGGGTVSAGLLGQSPYYAANGATIVGSNANQYNVQYYGSLGQAQYSEVNATIASGNNALAVSSAIFSANDCHSGAGCTGNFDKEIFLAGAGATGDLYTTIISFTNSTHVGLGANAGSNLSSNDVAIIWGDDDTSFINSANNAMTSYGGDLHFPHGNYISTSCNFSLAHASILSGAGRPSPGYTNGSTLFCLNPSLSEGMQITSPSLLYYNMAIVFPGTTAVGSGLQVVGGPFSQRMDCFHAAIVGFDINYDIQVGDEWVKNDCSSYEAGTYSDKIQNTSNNDAGDWTEAFGVYALNEYLPQYAYRTPKAHIYQLSSGGGKIIANKFLSGNINHSFIQSDILLNAGISTSELTISGNNFDHAGISIVLQQNFSSNGLISITDNNPTIPLGSSNIQSASISGTLLTITAMFTGSAPVLVGSQLIGSGVPVGEIILSQVSGVPGCISGTCTYNINISATVASENMTTCNPGIAILGNLTKFQFKNNLITGTCPIIADSINATVSNGKIDNTYPDAFNYLTGLGGQNGVVENGPANPVPMQDAYTFNPAWATNTVNMTIANYGASSPDAVVTPMTNPSYTTSTNHIRVQIGACGSSNFYMGIYQLNPNTGVFSHLADTGSISCPGTGTQYLLLNASVTFSPNGRLFYVWQPGDNTMSLVSVQGISAIGIGGHSPPVCSLILSLGSMGLPATISPIGACLTGTPIAWQS